MSTLLKISEVIDGSQLYSGICEPCIYFLINEGNVVYVGQSTSVYARLQVHKNDPRKIWERFFILPAPIERLDELELQYYSEFLPRFNTTPPTSAARGVRAKIKNLESRKKKIISKQLLQDSIDKVDYDLGIKRPGRKGV